MQFCKPFKHSIFKENSLDKLVIYDNIDRNRENGAPPYAQISDINRFMPVQFDISIG